MIAEQFQEGSIVCLVLFAIVAILTLVYMLRGIHILVTRSVESFNFVLFCIPVFSWAVMMFISSKIGFENLESMGLNIIIVAAGLLFSPLLMLHIQSQVSYYPVTTGKRLAWFSVPIIEIVLWAIHAFDLNASFDFMFGPRISVFSLIATVYTVIVLVRAYLLCFNVFYQMPKHMRRSTYHLLAAITALAVVSVLDTYFQFSMNASAVLLAFGLIIVLQTLFSAFFIANSSNVIVTSRDFVFQSLSTIVLTVSRKGNILDWNKKAKDGCMPLPNPMYKEPYPQYRQRILETYNGIVSKYDENVISVKVDDIENHLLFTWHDIGFLDRKFGFLVEVSDITKTYQTIRYFEEIALVDNLTGLNNRNSYIEEVKKIGVAENMPLCIIVGDVNNLKKTNDSIGHLQGDRLLCTISDAVKDVAKGNFFIARIGGDEIAILARNTEADAAKEFTEAVDAALSQIHDEHFGMPGISWGWAVMHSEAEDYNSLFREADAIMYESKKCAKEISLSGVVPDKR